MSDIRRSILWVIFGFSLVLLWDQWQIHNGREATFFPTQPPAAAQAPAQPGAGNAGVPAASAALAHAAPGTAPGAVAPSSIPRQQHVVSTDVLKLTFDSEGGSLVGADILQHAAVTGKADQAQPLTLLTQGPAHTYVAQTGLVRGTLPTHKTPMKLVQGGQSLADGQDETRLRFESEPVNGVVLAKTYTLARGSYRLGVQHEVINRSAAAITPQLYLQLVRDGSKADSDTPFYSL